MAQERIRNDSVFGFEERYWPQAPHQTKPINHEVFIHETFVVSMYNISWEVNSLWESFAPEYDVWEQFRPICHAGKHNCKVELLISCKEEVNLSSASPGNGSVVCRIKIDGHLVIISYLTN